MCGIKFNVPQCTIKTKEEIFILYGGPSQNHVPLEIQSATDGVRNKFSPVSKSFFRTPAHNNDIRHEWQSIKEGSR